MTFWRVALVLTSALLAGCGSRISSLRAQHDKFASDATARASAQTSAFYRCMTEYGSAHAKALGSAIEIAEVAAAECQPALTQFESYSRTALTQTWYSSVVGTDLARGAPPMGVIIDQVTSLSATLATRGKQSAIKAVLEGREPAKPARREVPPPPRT